MKQKIIVILLAILIGFSLSYYIFNKDKITTTKYLNAMQVGAFTNYENAKKCAERNQGIVVKDNNIYRVYISIISDESLLTKLENYYKDQNIKYYLKKIKVNEDTYKYINKQEQNIKTIESYEDIRYKLLLQYQNSL